MGCGFVVIFWKVVLLVFDGYENIVVDCCKGYVDVVIILDFFGNFIECMGVVIFFVFVCICDIFGL